MVSRSMVTRIIGAGVLSAAIFLPAFAATRTVPSASYPTITAAYNACNNGDIISITSSQSTAGITIAKSITMQNGSANPTVSIYLSSGFTIAANTVIFNNLKIYGKNASDARCIVVNAGKENFVMNGCTIRQASGGSTGYGVYDNGSFNSGYYGVTFSGTTEGLYGTNMDAFEIHYGSAGNYFTNPYRNIRTRKMNNALQLDWWIEAITFYAGNSNNATCFSAYNANATNIPWYWIEACSFQASGVGAKCTKSETSDAMNAINLQGPTFVSCP